MHRPVQVEPAKSNKSKCKKCIKTIEKGQLRAKVVDDRAFRQYLRKHPDAKGSQGYSRGYFEDMGGVISILKYFVHLRCYKPIYPHPKQPGYFKLTKATALDKQKFREWLQGEQEQVKQASSKPKKQKAAIKQSPTKKKKLNKNQE